MMEVSSMNTRNRFALALALVSACALAWPLAASTAATTRPFESATVRLYSDGKVVGEWEAVGAARVEGNTLVFPVRMGVQELRVRISGTFSVEPKP
jgi:hypothetical protein